MKIAYITSGAAGMYCGSCMRDNTLAAAINRLGHECLLIPTYTPLRTDEPDVSEKRVFFGGISIYLEQKGSLFRHLPRFVHWLLDRPGLIRFVSGSAIKTRPEDLGELTVSMLKGTDGNQRREVVKIVDWLKREVKPDVVCLSNILLSGMLPELRKQLAAPVVCTLQGDDIYIDWLPSLYRQKCLDLIRLNSRFISGYLAPCRYYADFMSGYLGIPREAMSVVYPGIALDGYGNEPAPRPNECVTIGYLARICPEKGLHVLVDAFAKLRQLPQVAPLRLRAAGYLGPRDRTYLDDLKKMIADEGWSDQFEYVGEVDHAEKIRFLQSLDIFSVPTTYREPKGLYLLEAWASGLPVVQPRHGSFPELIEATGGGVLVNPDDPSDLAYGLYSLVKDRDERLRRGERGRDTVRQRFHARRMAEETLQTLAHFCH